MDVWCTRTNTWFPAKVIGMTEDKVFVHFNNWAKKHDEWISKVMHLHATWPLISPLPRLMGKHGWGPETVQQRRQCRRAKQ
ncbi:unnamed protein product [Discosporangium mesarthrocarpum]